MSKSDVKKQVFIKKQEIFTMMILILERVSIPFLLHSKIIQKTNAQRISIF